MCYSREDMRLQVEYPRKASWNGTLEKPREIAGRSLDKEHPKSRGWQMQSPRVEHFTCSRKG